MPTYEYACTQCGQHVEVFQRLSEDPLTTCGVCGGPLRKVFHPAGIVFKGSGFYATDSRAKPASTSGNGDGNKETTGSGSKSSDAGSSGSSAGSGSGGSGSSGSASGGSGSSRSDAAGSGSSRSEGSASGGSGGSGAPASSGGEKRS